MKISEKEKSKIMTKQNFYQISKEREVPNEFGILMWYIMNFSSKYLKMISILAIFV